MSFLQSLFSNDKMKDMAFSLVKKQMKENDVKYFVLDLMDNGELDLLPYHASQQPIIMSKEKLDQLQGILDSMSGQVEAMSKASDELLAENARLVEMCTEQEKAHSQYAEENARLRETISRYQDKVGELIDDEIALNNLQTVTDGNDNAEAGKPI